MPTLRRPRERIAPANPIKSRLDVCNLLRENIPDFTKRCYGWNVCPPPPPPPTPRVVRCVWCVLREQETELKGETEGIVAAEGKYVVFSLRDDE